MSTPSVLHVVTAMDVGGLEVLVMGLARLQRQRGYRVNIACVGGWPGVLTPDLEALGVGVYPTTRYNNVRDFPAFYRSMRGIIRETAPTVLHIHVDGIVALIPLVVARLHGTRRFVRTIHSAFAYDTWPRARRRWRRVELAIARWFGARVVGVSEDVRQNEITQLGVRPKHVATLVNGVDLERFGHAAPDELPALASLIGRAVPREEVFLIGCVARFHPVKNHEQMIRAVAELRDVSLPRTPHLLLAGVGPRQDDMIALARELGVADRVHFLGLRRDVPALLQTIDLYVMTSLLEGHPISLIEAMAAGRPAVATRVDGLKNVVRDQETGLLVDLHDHVAYADAIARLIREPALCTRMGAAAKAVAEADYSLAACARQYERLYGLNGVTPAETDR